MKTLDVLTLLIANYEHVMSDTHKKMSKECMDSLIKEDTENIDFFKRMYRELNGMEESDRTFAKNKYLQHSKEVLTKAGFLDENGKIINKS